MMQTIRAEEIAVIAHHTNLSDRSARFFEFATVLSFFMLELDHNHACAQIRNGRLPLRISPRSIIVKRHAFNSPQCHSVLTLIGLSGQAACGRHPTQRVSR